MKEEYRFWVNHENKIISFNDISGYSKRVFKTQKEMVENIFKYVNKGYLVR